MAGWTCPDKEVIEWDGTIKAKKLKGDGSGITNISGTGDNLGNHIATQTVSGANLYMSDKVGIGTTSPSNLLDIESGTSARIELTKTGTGAGAGGIYNDGALNVVSHDALFITPADTKNLYLLYGRTGNVYAGQIGTGAVNLYVNGNVGIGTTNPSSELEVAGNLTVGNQDGGVWRGIRFSPYYFTTGYPAAIEAADLGTNFAGDMRFLTLATGGGATSTPSERMRITSTGYVGIGTTTPLAKLHVSGGLIVNNTVSGAEIISTGNVSGAYIYGDGSNLTNLPAESDPIWTAASAALFGNVATVSGAYTTHAADSSDPHGATLTQTNLSSTTVSGAAMFVTGDQTVASYAAVANIVHTSGALGAIASNYPIGTLWVQYAG